MTNLCSLSNEALEQRAQDLISNERRITTEILLHLREIERRMLYAERGYSNLIEYCVKVFKYSEPAAWRRVSAMRLLRDLPEVEEKIQSGELSLTVAAKVQSHFRQTQTKSADEKKEVVAEVMNLSTRNCERVLAEKKGESAPRETRTALAGGLTLHKLAFDEETEAILKEIRMELGKNLSTAELIKEAGKVALQTLKKRRDAGDETSSESGKNKRKMTSASHSSENTFDQLQENDIERRNDAQSALVARSGNNQKRCRTSIRPKVRRFVWRRDQGRCQYRDPLTGRQCESCGYLEIDHITPIAMGGTNEPDNLRLACRAHNQLYAVREFGREKMTQYQFSLL